jgi:hypothetical protein
LAGDQVGEHPLGAAARAMQQPPANHTARQHRFDRKRVGERLLDDRHVAGRSAIAAKVFGDERRQRANVREGAPNPIRSGVGTLRRRARASNAPSAAANR